MGWHHSIHEVRLRGPGYGYQPLGGVSAELGRYGQTLSCGGCYTVIHCGAVEWRGKRSVAPRCLTPRGQTSAGSQCITPHLSITYVIPR